MQPDIRRTAYRIAWIVLWIILLHEYLFALPGCQAKQFYPQGSTNKKATTSLRQSLLYRVIRLGLEPKTPTLKVLCSTC